MTAPNDAKSNLARAVCLPSSQGHEVLRRPAGFCSRRALRLFLQAPVQRDDRCLHRSARWTGAGRIGARGSRSSHFWPGVCSAGPWLGGSRASRKAQRGTRTARGATDILQSASLPASAGPAVLVQPESVRAELKLAVWRALFGSRGPRCSGFWAGRLRREGSRDELACPTRGQTGIGGQRMTRPQRRPARCEPHRRVASVSGARPGDALAGETAWLAGFHVV